LFRQLKRDSQLLQQSCLRGLTIETAREKCLFKAKYQRNRFIEGKGISSGNS